MSARAAFVLGLFLLLAAIVRGGIYSAGHDFVVNRFTGQFQFVPADEDNEEQTPIESSARSAEASRTLTAHRPGARVDRFGRGGAEWRAIRVGR